MAESLGEAVLELTADGRGLDRELAAAEHGARGHFSAIGAAALVAGAAILTGLAVTAKVGWDEMNQAALVTARTEAVLKSTGEAAGVTAGHVKELANAMLQKTGIDDEAIQTGENVLLAFTKIHNEVGKGKDIFDRATQATADWATATNGGAIPSAEMMAAKAQALGRALQDPEDSFGRLKRAGIEFTDAEKESVKAMQDSGDMAGAQAVILDKLEGKFRGTAEAAGATLPGQLSILKENFANLAGALMENLVPALAVATTWLNDNLPKAAAAVKSAFEAIKPALEAVVGFLRDNIPPAVEAVTRAFDYLAPRVEEAWRQVQAVAQRVIDWYHSSLLPAVQTVVTGIIAFWDEFGGTITRVLTIALQTFTRVFGDILSIVRHVVELIVDLISGDWSGAWDDFKKIVSKALDAVHALLSGAVRTLFTIAEKIGSEIVKGIVAGLSALASLVGRELGKLAGAIADIAGKAPGWAAHVGLQIITGIIHGLVSLDSAVNDKLAALQGVILRLSLQVLGWAEAIGAALVHGVVNGLESAASSAYSAVTGFVGGLISRAKSAAHIGSPSLDFVEIGKAMAEGISVGVDTGSKDAVASLEKAVGVMMSAMKANQPEIERLTTMIGKQAVEGVVGGVVGVQQTLAQKLHQAVTERIQQELKDAQAAVETAKGDFSTAFSSLAQNAVTAFNNGMTGWVSPSQKILDKMQLADQAKQYSDAVNTALAKIIADKAAIQAAADAHDVEAQKKAEAALVADEATFHAAVRTGQEYYLGQKAQAEQTAHDKAATEQAAHLGALLAQLQASLPNHVAQWVKKNGDALADGEKFSAASFIQHDKLLSGLLSKLKESLSEHPGEYKKTYNAILKAVNDMEGPMEEAGKKNADAHKRGIDSKREETVRTTQGIVNESHDAITSQNDAWYNAGAGLGQALADGLRSTGMAAAGQAAADIAGVIAGFLKPGSPTKFGPLSTFPNWAAYFLPGLRDLKPELERHVEALAGTVRSGAIPRGGPVGHGGAGGDLVLVINGAELGRINREELNRKARAGATLFVNPIAG